ncbi:MAG TPA: hypothetical protein VMF59_11615, partial [Bacteroidota bacterium]|nr:hypothetical protein [Bacteroidota bacterium]
FTNPHCMPDENNNSIYYCTGPKYDLRRYWIVVYRMDPGFTDALKRGGVDSAVAYYYQRKTQDPGVILFTEQQMNSLGYSYLSRKQAKEAIALFRLNVEAYPGSFNVYDSLGEALMADGQYSLSVQNYERSLELNPGNDNGRRKLEELNKIMSSTQPGPSNAIAQ